MKNNVFLFNGEEKFLLFQDIGKWKKSFSDKYGQGNIFDFKSDEIDAGAIMNTIFSGGLFVSRKLIFVWGLPKDTDSDNKIPEAKYKAAETKIMENFENIPSDIVVVFVSFTPDKRTAAYKFLSVNCTVKTYSKLNDKEKKVFVKNILGDKITDTDIEYLLQSVGDDMFAVNNETSKLNFYCMYNNIDVSREIIDKVVFSKLDINTFDILDKMFFSKKETLKLLDEIQQQSFDTFQFLGMLYWGTKNIIMIMDLYKKGENSSKELASKLGIHPFVVAKNLKMINQLLEIENQIKEFYKGLIQVDLNIKTGRIPAELFWFEIKTLILK